MENLNSLLTYVSEYVMKRIRELTMLKTHKKIYRDEEKRGYRRTKREVTCMRHTQWQYPKN